MLYITNINTFYYTYKNDNTLKKIKIEKRLPS